MLQLPRFITRTLSTRLSLMGVSALTLLLLVSLAVMYYFSQQQMKREALETAAQTLEGTIERIDNLLLNVEQASGNMYFNMLQHLNQPDMMATYCRQLVETNPYIIGCAIAFEPYYYKDREYFMAYVYRNASDKVNATDSLVMQAETYGNQPYTQQRWFTEPMSSGNALWLIPLADMSDMEPITTFSLPIYGSNGKPVGVMGVDVSLRQLSAIIHDAKPTPNSYCTLLDKHGMYIVHPDTSVLAKRYVHAKEEIHKNFMEVAQMMVSGDTGYHLYSVDNDNYYVFFKPFRRAAVPGRSEVDLGWSAGIVYPEDDVFGDYKQLFYYVLAIALVGLLLLFVLSRAIIHSQLKPLQELASSAQFIAEGNYHNIIDEARRKDEIGRLKDNFRQMQLSLSANIRELDQLKSTLNERGERLREAYAQAKEADRMKTSFLHNMSNQMLEPTSTLIDDVNKLYDIIGNGDVHEVNNLVSDIERQGHRMTSLLNRLLQQSAAKEEKGGRS